MPFLNINLGNVEEQKPVAAGKYLTQITSAKVAESGPNSKVPGSPILRVSIGIPSEPTAPNISHFISFPTGEDDDSAEFKLLMLKRFLHAYTIPYGSDGLDLEELAMQMVGAEAEVEVTLSEPDESGNVYNRIRLPKIHEEAPKTGRRKR